MSPSQYKVCLVDQIEQKISYELRSDDGTAFEHLFKTYFIKLVKYAAEIVKDIDVAEEIVENTFVKLWENRKVIDINTSHQQYLYKSVYNSCLNHFKHIEVENKYKLFFYNHIAPTEMDNQYSSYPMNNLLVEELQNLIRKTIDDLPDQCKKVFELSRYENLTNDEIAKDLNVSINTVKTHIGRALNKLRLALKEYILMIFI